MINIIEIYTDGSCSGNPGPDWDNEYRPGDNLYSNSALALDADTGKIKWFFQYILPITHTYHLSYSLIFCLL